MTTRLKGQSGAPSRRRARAVESFKSAAECIGPIEPEMALFAITRGQFSMIDCILHTIDQLGPCHVAFWTWVIADYEVECVDRLRIDDRILSARMMIDPSARKGPVLERWAERFGAESVRLVTNHAKIARVWNDKLRVLIRGSMNLNFNPRFEQLDVTEGGGDFELVREIEDELPILPLDAPISAVTAASKIGQAFEPQTLKLFRGLKTWKP